MLALMNQWNDNGGIFSVAEGTQPASAWGTAVTPAQNAYGSYAQVLAATAYETHWIEININSVFQTGVSRQCVVTIGVDEAGGASYTDTISHLIATGAKTYADPGEWITAGGVWYAFPLRIKAGSTIAAKASVSTVSVTDIRVAVRLRGKPSRPDLIWSGKVVETFGAVSASTFGTAITPGTAAEGAWTAIGGAASKKIRYLDYGFGFDSAAITVAMLHVDIGAGSAGVEHAVISNARAYCAGEESFRKEPAGGFIEDVFSHQLYARAQSSGTPPGSSKVAIYGVA